jgi:hypothetical protein
MAVAVALAASPASAQLGTDAQKTYDEYSGSGAPRHGAGRGRQGLQLGGLEWPEDATFADAARQARAMGYSGAHRRFAGLQGHGAANGNAFPRKYGACIHAFIETGVSRSPRD